MRAIRNMSTVTEGIRYRRRISAVSTRSEAHGQRPRGRIVECGDGGDVSLRGVAESQGHGSSMWAVRPGDKRATRGGSAHYDRGESVYVVSRRE